MKITIAPPKEIKEMIAKSQALDLLIHDININPWISKLAFNTLCAEVYKSWAELGTTVARKLFPDRVNAILEKATSLELQSFVNGVRIQAILHFHDSYMRALDNLSIWQKIFLQRSSIQSLDIDWQDRAISSFMWMGIVNFRWLLAVLSNFSPTILYSVEDYSYVLPHMEDPNSGFCTFSVPDHFYTDIRDISESIPGIKIASVFWLCTVIISQWVLDRYKPTGWGYNFSNSVDTRNIFLSKVGSFPVFRKRGFKNPFPPKPADNPLFTPHRA